MVVGANATSTEMMKTLFMGKQLSYDTAQLWKQNACGTSEKAWW